MFLGHFAVGFASKRLAPRTSVALLISAALLADVLWPIFLLFGWEHVRIDPTATRFSPLDLYDFPWSHSLLALLTLATALACIYWRVTKYRIGAAMIWIGVLSHWVLDWITHRPDMPLYPGSRRFGLGLWNSMPGTMIVELAVFIVAIWLYARTTRAKDRIGRYAFLAFALFLLVIYIANPFNAPPESVSQLIWAGIAAAILVIPWAWWFDSHRALRS